MDPLVRYYLHEAGRVHGDNGIGTIYSNPPFIQRGHGIGTILGGLWRSFVRPLLWHGAKTVGSETLAAGRNILTDMTDPDAIFRDAVRRNVRDLAHRILKRLSELGRKHKRVKRETIFKS
jgi:hypothetical protein